MSELFTVVIPARFESARLPGKVLADIHGKSMIQRVIEAAQKSDAHEIVVATDDRRVLATVEDLGISAVMTSIEHASGSDRIAEVCEKRNWDDQMVIVNVQGDEPAMPPVLINQVAKLLMVHGVASMATLSTPMLSQEEMQDPSMVKVVTNVDGTALYFSRAPIPWKRSETSAVLDSTGYSAARRHLGIYAYRSGYIRQFSARQPCPLESLERLEQLRALWHGERIVCAEAEVTPLPGVDTLDDLEKMREFFASSQTDN